ncbi:MAG: copper resistance protein CopC/CopD [Thermoleophilaceae bacterium]|nr:copper resistance protein CopC/CopD [Thermoleophilaceae bacterium]
MKIGSFRLRALRCLVAGLTVAAAVLTLGVTSALAHSAFIGSTPEPGVHLEQPPAKITIAFTEPLERKLSTVRLVAVDSGERLPVEITAPSSKRLAVVPTGPLRRGAYEVRWHTVSTLDGHALEGSFSFGVQAPAAGGEHSLEQSPLARDGWLRVLARGAMYAALLVFVGALLLDVLLGRERSGSWLVPPDAPDATRLRRRERAVSVELGLVAAAAAAVAALADSADAAGSLSASAISDYLLSGLPGFARLATVVFVLLAALIAARGLRAAAVPAALSLLAVAASGHASSADPRLPTVALDWVHLLAAATWLGGIALVVVVWGPRLGRHSSEVRGYVARRVLPAFGRVALPAFLVVASTGSVSALVQLGHVQALWESPYGRLLLVKIALVGLIAAASYVHALRLRPQLIAANPHPDGRVERRHWRLLRSEPLLGLGVVAAVAFLVAFPLPPRQLGEADEAVAAGPPCDPCPLPRPKKDELAVAEHAGSRLVAGWLRREDGGVAGTLRVLDVDGKPSIEPVRVSGARQSPCGRGCWRFSIDGRPRSVDVSVAEGDRRYVARLAAQWRSGDNARARRLLMRVQRTMSRLRSLREVETVTSGPGSFARTVYRLQGPDRFAYVTNGASRSVVVGRYQWFRGPGQPWGRQRYGGGGPRFRTRSWFRWTPYAQEVRLLRLDRRDGLAELALMDPGTPVWLRLTIDLGTMRASRERMIARAHYMTRRYLAFNEPVSIEPPRR